MLKTSSARTKPVLRIRDILRRIGILGSGHWIMDPDPALFISGFQETNKKDFWLLLTVATFTSAFIKKSQNS
jgi:hypothetical protein